MTTSSVYLDYNATTPIDPAVQKAMINAMDIYGNPSSTHQIGQSAKEVVESARHTIAQYLGTTAEHIYFTSGATEANNLILIQCCPPNSHLITSQIEHSSIYTQAQELESCGVEVTYIPVDKTGIINPINIQNAIKDNTTLISIMSVNNELGTIQPIQEIGTIAHHAKVPFLTDAVQAIGKLNYKIDDYNADFITMSGHKIYGPKGIGALYIKDHTQLNPLLLGGGQEKGMRSGTENTVAIAGIETAFKLIATHMESENNRIKQLRDQLLNQLKSK